MRNVTPRGFVSGLVSRSTRRASGSPTSPSCAPTSPSERPPHCAQQPPGLEQTRSPSSYCPPPRLPRRPSEYSGFQVISMYSFAYPADVQRWPVVDASESAQKLSPTVYVRARLCWFFVPSLSP